MTLRYDKHDIKMMDDADFNKLAAIVNAEQDMRSFLRDCKAEVDKRIDAYIEYAPTEAKDIKGLQQDALVGPGEQIIVDGKTYKNVARSWLRPFKAGPVNFAAGWEEQQGGVL